MLKLPYWNKGAGKGFEKKIIKKFRGRGVSEKALDKWLPDYIERKQIAALFDPKLREASGAYRAKSIFFDKKYKSKLEKLKKKYKKGNWPFNWGGGIQHYGDIKDVGGKLEWSGIPAAKYNDAVEFFVKNKINPRG